MLKRREVSLWLTASEGFLHGHLTLFQSLGKNSVVAGGRGGGELFTHARQGAETETATGQGRI